MKNSIKITIAFIAFNLMQTNVNAQVWNPGVTPGETVTTDIVGIGVNDPTADLHIVGDQYAPQGNSHGGPVKFDRAQGFVPFKINSQLHYPSKTMENGFYDPNIMEVWSSYEWGTGTGLGADAPIFFIKPDGRVGIGTEQPSAKLEVIGNAIIDQDLTVYTNEQINGNAQINGKLRVGNLAANGNYANYALSVDGDIICKRAVVQISSWADFVFAPDYQLQSLDEIASFVKANHHLPNVPTTAEVKEKGIDVSEMNKILLQKVEEMTLYQIEMKKQIEVLQSAITNLKK